MDQMPGGGGNWIPPLIQLKTSNAPIIFVAGDKVAKYAVQIVQQLQAASAVTGTNKVERQKAVLEKQLAQLQKQLEAEVTLRREAQRDARPALVEYEQTASLIISLLSDRSKIVERTTTVSTSALSAGEIQ